MTPCGRHCRRALAGAPATPCGICASCSGPNPKMSRKPWNPYSTNSRSGPWDLPKLEKETPSATSQEQPEMPKQKKASESHEQVVTTESKGGLPPIFIDKQDLPEAHFVLVPQFPLSYRQVAQAWRRMRQPVRQGAPVELDIDATIQRRCRQGVCSEIALMPRRVNTAPAAAVDRSARAR